MCSAQAACVHGVAGASIVAMLAALRRTERCISASSQNGGGRIAGADERQGRGERFDERGGLCGFEHHQRRMIVAAYRESNCAMSIRTAGLIEPKCSSGG